METNRNEEFEIDLQDLFFALMSKLWAIIAALLIGAIAAGLYTTLAITPMYKSSSSIYILNQTTDLSTLSMSDLQVGSALTNDYRVLVKSRAVLNKVISNLELDMTYEDLNNSVTTYNEDNTRVLTIMVHNPDPYMAKTIVDEVTQVSIKRIAEIMDTVEPNIVDEGTVDTVAISPNLKKNVLIGALIGFILAAGIIVVRFLMNDSIKTSEDVEKYLGLNTLGVIPMEEGTTKAAMRKRDIEEDKRQRKHHKKNGKEKQK